ncbi:hypothetical protein [Saccharopolyspora taberi]|uniref:Class III extradiol dioxygenase subunit B-like domain-containing protein n=1 Tax=Saccharopolyspora taberi TaxID=60895 RepID=A0ABN3VGJ0_9PSEU
MITRVAVVPYPPLLLPELTVRAGSETARLRDACLRAVSSLTQSSAEWVAVGADRSGARVLGPHERGTYAGFGVDVPVALSDEPRGEPDPLFPLPALAAAWLREKSGAHRVEVRLLAADAPPSDCLDCGRALAEEAQALLVLADGTNCAMPNSPYPPDDRAEPVDELIRGALADADGERLLELDPDLTAEVGVEGRAALQVLGGLPGTWRGELLYSAAPFGVAYHVAVWTRTDVVA